MSQEYSSSKRARRTARSQKNKPVLVTSSTNDIENAETERSVGIATQTIAEPKLLVVPTPEPIEQPARKLPRFFSNVKKNEQDAEQKETKEAEVVQARLARATRGKAPIEAIGTVPAPAKASKSTIVESKGGAATTPAKPATTKPQGLFKTRYIIGMGVYLIAADFLGLYEQNFLKYLGLEKELTRFNLFGGVLHVNTSTILFLASLVIILVLLARFDLIPRSLGGASAAQRRAGQSQTKPNSTTPGERVIPPTVRQGVKGSDDTLYQQYRNGQRRQKKK